MVIVNCTEDYFKQIDAEDKAYWLGFLYADGCVAQNRKQLIINLSPVDYLQLNAFKNAIKATSEIKYRDNGRYISLSIFNKCFVEHLVNKGCVPAKSLILTFPDKTILSPKYYKHFIRGYFDGDGCFSAILRKRKNKPNPIFEGEINFIGTYDILYNIIKNLPCKGKEEKIFKDGNIYKFRIQNKPDIKNILNYLYADSNIYLERKYKKYLLNIDHLEDKRKKQKNIIPVTTTA